MNSFYKILTGAVVGLLISALLGYLYARNEVNHMLGDNTLKADVSDIVPVDSPIAIINVNVLSADTTHMIPSQTVLIEDGEIVEVSGSNSVPNGYLTINGKGKFLIPGLIDSHVHIKKSENDLLLYISNGVTMVGEMTGMPHHFELRQEIRQGRIGPQLFIASPKVTSQDSMKATFRSAFEKRHQNYSTPEDARKAVQAYKQQGYEAIKASSFLRPEVYHAIADEALKQEIPLIGHLPVGVSLQDLYQSGQSQLSHIESITQYLMNAFGEIKDETAFLQYIANKADSIARQLKQHEITLSSTLWLHLTRPEQTLDVQGFVRSIQIAYQNPGWVEGSAMSSSCYLDQLQQPFEKGAVPQHLVDWAKRLEIYAQANKIITQALVTHGVNITAGTDSLGACGVVAGFSLHDELETLSAYGMSNAQALYAATVAPAKWMNTRRGIIAKGYRADMVLLTKNPLSNISHTREIDAVIFEGKLLRRPQLDALLSAVKAANNQSRQVSISEYIE